MRRIAIALALMVPLLGTAAFSAGGERLPFGATEAAAKKAAAKKKAAVKKTAACRKACKRAVKRKCKGKKGAAKRKCVRKQRRKCLKRNRRCRAKAPKPTRPAKPKQPKPAPEPYRIGGFAYGQLLNQFGGWVGPKTKKGKPDLSVFDEILAARPTHLRLAQPPNNCRGKDCSTLQPKDPKVHRRLVSLRDAGIKIGASLNVWRQGRDDEMRVRPPAEVLKHACEIKKADRDGIYSWLFVDFATYAPKRQEIVRGIERGKGCAAGGWQVMVNASGYHRPGNSLPAGGVAYAKRFDLLDASPEQLRAAAEGKRAVITESDRRFIELVRERFPRAVPVLKLEIPHQSGEIFAKLPAAVQKGLLRRWAQAQRELGFQVIYPLFIYPGSGQPVYDAREAGTLGLQRDLLAADLSFFGG